MTDGGGCAVIRRPPLNRYTGIVSVYIYTHIHTGLQWHAGENGNGRNYTKLPWILCRYRL